jgi:hypothetical protein
MFQAMSIGALLFSLCRVLKLQGEFRACTLRKNSSCQYVK